MKTRGIAFRIWACLGIFALGYVLSAVMEQVQSRNLEQRLQYSARTLFPAAQSSQQAEATFVKMIRSFNDAVLTENQDGLTEARQQSGEAAELLRATNGELSAAVEAIGREGAATYGAMLSSKGNLTPEIQSGMRKLSTGTEDLRTRLHRQSEQASTDLLGELRAEGERSSAQRHISLAVLIATMVIAIVVVRFTLQRSVIRPVVRVIHGVEEAAQESALAAEQVSKTGGAVADSASDQAACIEQTSASLEEVLSMTRSNAQMAADADLLMSKVTQRIENASKAMSKLDGAMTRINAANKKIAGVLHTIEDIAFRTNILALNAAVEAARAGEAGAGFSVVADEVRSLAHRSSEAARGTAELIEETAGTVASATNMVRDTVGQFQEIADGVGGGHRMMTDVARASQEQRRGVEEITKAVHKMDLATQSNAHNALQSAEVSGRLQEQVDATRGLIAELAAVVGVGAEAGT